MAKLERLEHYRTNDPISLTNKLQNKKERKSLWIKRDLELTSYDKVFIKFYIYEKGQQDPRQSGRRIWTAYTTK